MSKTEQLKRLNKKSLKLVNKLKKLISKYDKYWNNYDIELGDVKIKSKHILIKLSTRWKTVNKHGDFVDFDEVEPEYHVEKGHIGGKEFLLINWNGVVYYWEKGGKIDKVINEVIQLKKMWEKERNIDIYNKIVKLKIQNPQYADKIEEIWEEKHE